MPARGLAVARMCAHITYLSEQALTRKFGRRLQNAPKDPSEAITLFGDMFEVESYLRHQGSTFVQRFDANCYLTITRAMDYFDLAADREAISPTPSSGTKTRFLLVSFTSDWLFPTTESRAIARALNRAGANVSFVEFPTDKGHDAFLLDEPDFHRTLAGFLLVAAQMPCADWPGHRMSTHDPVRFVAKNMRVDLALISEMIAPGTRVLDIGCGDGSLIDHLFRTKGCDARGIEIDMVEVIRSVALRPAGDARRCRQRPAALSRRRIRLRRALAHPAGGGAAARGAAADAAHRRARGGQFSEFRPLAVAAGNC